MPSSLQTGFGGGVDAPGILYRIDLLLLLSTSRDMSRGGRQGGGCRSNKERRNAMQQISLVDVNSLCVGVNSAGKGTSTLR